jgi:multidrug efflux system outer membrane protein
MSIKALAGVESLDVGKLLEYGSRVPLIQGAIHLPIFDAGRLKAQYGGAQAAIDAAVSTYNDTVISAARDVATQATTREQIQAQRDQRAQQVEAAQRLKETAAARVRQQVADSRTVLTATESWIDQRDALLQLDAAALSADVALQRALGGGYEFSKNFSGSPNSAAPPTTSTSSTTPAP